MRRGFGLGPVLREFVFFYSFLGKVGIYRVSEKSLVGVAELMTFTLHIEYNLTSSSSAC